MRTIISAIVLAAATLAAPLSASSATLPLVFPGFSKAVVPAPKPTAFSNRFAVGGLARPGFPSSVTPEYRLWRGGIAGVAAPIGGSHSGYVGAARISASPFDSHAGAQAPGYRSMAVGVGAEIAPPPQSSLGFSASYYYYPELSGAGLTPNGTQPQQYKLQTFSAGVHAAIGRSSGFAEVGVSGDHTLGTQTTTTDSTQTQINAGVGIHF